MRTNYLRGAGVGRCKGTLKKLFRGAAQLMPIALIAARITCQHYRQPHVWHCFWLTRRKKPIAAAAFREKRKGQRWMEDTGGVQRIAIACPQFLEHGLARVTEWHVEPVCILCVCVCVCVSVCVRVCVCVLVYPLLSACNTTPIHARALPHTYTCCAPAWHDFSSASACRVPTAFGPPSRLQLLPRPPSFPSSTPSTHIRIGPIPGLIGNNIKYHAEIVRPVSDRRENRQWCACSMLYSEEN